MGFKKRNWETNNQWMQSQERRFPLHLRNAWAPSLRYIARGIEDMQSRLEELEDPALDQFRKLVDSLAQAVEKNQRAVAGVKVYADKQSKAVCPIVKKFKDTEEGEEEEEEN